MFLRIIDHRMQLFPMVANHRSSNAVFAMYCSSVSLSIHGFHFRPTMGGLKQKLWIHAGNDEVIYEQPLTVYKVLFRMNMYDCPYFLKKATS